MARVASPLTDSRIRQAKPGAKPVKLADGGGMYLLLRPDGSRYWRLDYRYSGKRKTLALGVYPDISLGEARKRRQAAKALLAEGRDPGAERKADKAIHKLRDAAGQVCPSLTCPSLATLRESEARFRLLLDSSPEAIFGIDTQGICTFVNPACLNMLGYTQAEMLGKSVHALIHHTYPDGRPYPNENCHVRCSTLQGQSTHADNEVHWRKDGSSFPVEYWSRPMYRNGELVGAVVNFVDITDRKRAEEALRDSEARFRAMAEHSADWIWSLDTGGRYTYSNQQGVAILGYSVDAFLAMDPDGMLHPDDLPLRRETFLNALSARDGWRNVVLRWRHRNGTYRTFESSASALYSEAW